MATERRVIRMELNRVEGDMEIKLELEGHTVIDAWCIGTMFRGYRADLARARSPRRAGDRAADLRHLQHVAALRRHAALEIAYRSADRPQRDRGSATSA